MYVLDAHTLEIHDDSIMCNLCDDTFEKKKDLMIDKKEDHTEKVEFCWHYFAGTFLYPEQKCWFMHGKKDSNSNTSEHICNTVNTFVEIRQSF